MTLLALQAAVLYVVHAVCVLAAAEFAELRLRGDYIAAYLVALVAGCLAMATFYQLSQHFQ